MTPFFAWLHFFSIFLTVGFLFAQWALYRPPLRFETARLLPKLDAFYGVASLTAVGSGFARALWFEKGWAFYQHNPVFWLKVGVVTLWALLSLVPTFHYFGWRSHLARGQCPEPSPREMRRVQSYILGQILLLPWVPLLAVSMARGVGL